NELDFEDKLYRLYTIALGLNAIHEKGFVHHDLSSSIILVDDIECYITDFGLSRSDKRIVSFSDDGLGTPSYMAPEVILREGQLYTQASDIYAFGVSAYEIMTGLPPYCDKKDKHLDFIEVIIKVSQGSRPQFPDEPKIPQLLEDL